MNELQIIRSQLAAEQSHAAEVANACAAVLGSTGAAPAPPEAIARFRDACVSYLVWVLARFEESDQTLAELPAARQGQTDGEADGAAAMGARPLAGLVGQPGTSREALARLETALAAGESGGARAAWQEFARFFNSAWTPRRAALERALAEHLSVADWRAISAIDADSILDERNRYARVLAQLPAGIELRAMPPADRPPGGASSQRKTPGNP
ncbi:MAG TPA: hypothetical protein VGN43_07860 [Steroidobacteraceae bacterium]|nr:hypothetical protein [Steroidobacteraceae bacterium]